MQDAVTAQPKRKGRQLVTERGYDYAEFLPAVVDASALSSPRRPYQEVTQEQITLFLSALCQCANVSKAISVSGVKYHTAFYQLRDKDPKFREAWNYAKQIGLEALEGEGFRRAQDGVEEPVFYQGVEVARVIKYSDNLLMFLLKGGFPDKYRERFSQEVSGPGGGPIQNLTITAEVSETDMASIYARMLKGEG